MTTPTEGSVENSKAEKRAWLVMLYLAGDDVPPKSGTTNGSMSEEVTRLVRRLQQTLSVANSNMHLVILADGVLKLFSTKTRSQIFYLSESGLQELTFDDADENVDSGNDKILTDLIEFACTNYPAEHTMLAIVGHGGGWSPDFRVPIQPSGMPNQPGWYGLCQDHQTGSSLSTKNLGKALAEVNQTLKAIKILGERTKLIDVLFLDACLMGMIECAYDVSDEVDYFVASENLLWAVLPYEKYFTATFPDAETTPLQMAKRIVENYNIGAGPAPFTIAALDLKQMENLVPLVKDLATKLLTFGGVDAQPGGQFDKQHFDTLKKAYVGAQKFDYDNDRTIDPEREAYVDLYDFAQQLRSADLALPVAVAEAAQKVMEAICLDDDIRKIGELSSDSIAPVPILELPADSKQVLVAQRTLSGQTLNNDGKPVEWDLSKSYGLSIYLPIGVKDLRPTLTLLSDPVFSSPSDQSKETDWLDYYTEPNDLRFTQEAKEWVELLTSTEPHVEHLDVPAPGGGGVPPPSKPIRFASPVLLPIP